MLQTFNQHSGQFLTANGRMWVSDLFLSSLVKEKSRVSALARKSVQTIVNITITKFRIELGFYLIFWAASIPDKKAPWTVAGYL